MSPHSLPTRRDVLKTAALGALTLPLLGSVAKGAQPAAAPAPAGDLASRPDRLRLGIAGYSLRDLSLEDAIASFKVMRVTNAGVFRKHCDWEKVTTDQAAEVAAKYRAVGVAITSSGVINLGTDEAKCRKVFENVRAAGMKTMLCKPLREALPLVEKLAKEYDQQVAIHNHGPEDEIWPSPYDAWKAIEKLDAHIGLCIDVGHTMRAGVDPVESIGKCASRLYDLHMKDSLAVPGTKKDIPVEVGAGRLDIRGIVQALLKIKYQGVVSFEYEKVGGNPLIGLAESIGHVRGLLAAVG